MEGLVNKCEIELADLGNVAVIASVKFIGADG